MATKDKPKTMTPRLRFPEFRDKPGWDTCILESIAERKATRNSDRAHARVLTNSAEHGVLDQRDYFDREIASAEKIDTYYVVERGDYVYNPRTSAIAPVGPISRNNLGTGVMSPLYTVFRLSNDYTDFYEHYFKSAAWHPYLRSISSTGARHDRMSITSSAFMRMPVPTPAPAEQRRIAACLTSLDERITAEGRKLEALRTHKKGLMQQLFTREGETRPRLRFSEFLDKPDWHTAKLSTILDLVSGVHLSPDEYGTEGEVPYFTGPSDFTNATRSIAKWTSASANVAKRGDTIITVKGSGVGDLMFLELPMVSMGRQLMAARPTTSSGRFMLYLLESKRQRFEDLASGNLIPGLSRGDILDLQSSLPADEAEQQRIAACLSSLDALIVAQSRKLDSLRVHKKGLMQQLFPSSEEV